MRDITITRTQGSKYRRNACPGSALDKKTVRQYWR